MNHKTLKTALPALMLGLSITLGAQAGPDEREPHSRAASGPPSLVAQMHGALKRLDLDESQRAAVRDVFEQHRNVFAANQAASRDNRQALHTVVTAEPLDADILAGVAELEGQLAAERVMLFGEVASEVYALLSEEQRAQLQQWREHLADRGPRRGHRRPADNG